MFSATREHSPAKKRSKIFEAAKQHGLSVRAHVGQLSRDAAAAVLAVQSASFDHMDHVNDDDIRATGQARHGCHACAGRKLFSGLEGLSTRATVDRRRRASGSGDGLQSRHLADAQHADGDVAGMHAYEDVAGRSNFAAATINGAWALAPGASRKGSIEPGKDADLAVFDGGRLSRNSVLVRRQSLRATVLNGRD